MEILSVSKENASSKCLPVTSKCYFKWQTFVQTKDLTWDKAKPRKPNAHIFHFLSGKMPSQIPLWGTTHSSCKSKPWNDCIKIVQLSDHLLIISYSVFLLTFTVCWNTLQLCCYLSFIFILKNECISFFINISVLFTTTSILVFHKHFCVFQYHVQESKSGFSIALRGNELQKDKYICNFLFLDQVTSFSEYLIYAFIKIILNRAPTDLSCNNNT